MKEAGYKIQDVYGICIPAKSRSFYILGFSDYCLNDTQCLVLLLRL